VPVVLQSPGNASGSVTVANPATNPVLVRNLDEPGRAPYHSEGFFAIQGNVGGATVSGPSVPSGKRLVIESISGFISLDHATPFQVAGLVVGTTGVAYAPAVFQGTQNGKDSYVFNAHVLAYADAGQGPSVLVQFSDATLQTPGSGLNAAISGYLVNVP
jgi:hypothetical protein